MSTHQEFKFQYMVVTNTATLDGRDVRFKMGLRTQKTELSSLKHLYIYHHMGGDLQELILTYSHGHKLKKIRIYSNEGEVGFDQAVAAILGVCPLGQSAHPPATPAWPEGQGVHVVRFAEYVPSGHTSQPPILAFIRR